MDALRELKLKWSFGYNGSQLCFVDDNILVYSCGNTLTFIQSDGKHIHSCVSEGKGVGSLTVCQKAGLIAYCETTLEPKIFILSYPSCGVQIALEGGAQLEFGCITFSEDGKKLASLSSLPDFKLVIWNCSEGNVICQANIGSGGSQLSFNPLNWKHLCLVGTNRICLYNLEQSDAELFLSPIEVDIPDRLMPVGSRVSPKLLSAGVGTDPEGTGGRQERRNIHGIISTAPPNMKQVLYRDSYDEFMQKRSPVEPVSHCWSAQQTVYIGCEHGQLLLVDFESGIVSITANPEITMQQRSAGSSSKLSAIKELQTGQESTPKTGHALLREGAVSILTLSKRGLFTAGKDGLIQCFDVGDSLPLVDKLDVGQPVGCLAWSCSYDKLAIGTRNGTILLVDPVKLEGNATTLVSDHHFSDVIGIDVLGPGLQYFVSCKCDGILEVWDISEALVVSKLNLNLNTKCTTLCCPISCSVAIVGTESGVLNVVSLTDITAPHLVQQMFLHRNPLKYTLYDQQGKFMVSTTDDGLIFLHDCRPTSNLAVLGYTDTNSPGSLLDFSIIRDSEQLRLAALSKAQDKCLVTLLMIPDCILYGDVPQKIYADATKRLSNDFVIRQLIVLNKPVSCFKLVAENIAISLAAQHISHFILPISDEKDMEWELTPNDCFSVGELRNGKIISSFHQKWLGIGSTDGHIRSLTVKKPVR